MRDVALSAVFAMLILQVFKRPEIGAYLWAWVSLMNPHKLTYGFANALPFAMVTACVTFLAFVFTRERKAYPFNFVTACWLSLIVWMTLTSFLSINDPVYVWERWWFVMKIHLMMIITLKLLRGRKQIDLLIWVVVFSIGFYGAKGGLWTLATGGGGRVWGPPGGMLAGNNEVAVALVTLMPFIYYLYQTSSQRWVKRVLGVSGLFVALGALGTQSRGALLGLLAMAFMMGLKGKNPVGTSIGILALIALMIAFMPDTWTTRMDTIQSYQGDSSAMSRIYTWQTLWNVVLDRPFLGAGFGTDNIVLFSQYAPTNPEYKLFFGKVWVAHSIYFQAMGEHGFVGLALYLMIGVGTYRMSVNVRKRALINPLYADWVPLLMRMSQVSLVGFAVGGAFLSLMHLDLIYYIVAFVVLTDVSMRESAQAAREAARPPIPRLTPQGRAATPAHPARSKLPPLPQRPLWRGGPGGRDPND
jgi:probable O-glycosylation ligase (exosortase A-associated)